MKVHPILGAGNDSNIYLATVEEGAYLIDTGTGMYSAKNLQEIRTALYPKKLLAIILTHIHIDHSGGANELSTQLGVPVMIHDAEAPALDKGDEKLSCAWMIGARLKPVKPKRLIGGEFLPGRIEVIHTPGHSQGSISLYHKESKSLFPGDVFFLYGGVGRWDLPTGNYPLLLDSIRSFMKLDIERVYPGHGGFTESGGKEQIEMAYASLDPMKGVG